MDAEWWKQPMIPLSHQLREARSASDDWTGLKDAAERRKRQNRLNVRAYRRRKAAEPNQEQIVSRQFRLDAPNEAQNKQLQAIRGIQNDNEGPWLLASCKPVRNWDAINISKLLTPLPVDQRLLVLIRYNTVRAVATNMALLQVTHVAINDECKLVRGNIELFPAPEGMPASLAHTELQRTAPHEQWIDLIPHPRMRDNLIRLAGSYDQNAFMADGSGGMHESGTPVISEKAGMLAWAEPWHIRGWELTEPFLRKWIFLFEGCQDIIEATNFWRVLRGEDELDLQVG